MRVRSNHVKARHSTTYAVIKGEEIEISLREKLQRTIVEEKNWNTAIYKPTGVLIFKMDRSAWVKEWVDGKLPLEQQLSNIIASLEIKAQTK